jgi:predicted acetyltransferase
VTALETRRLTADDLEGAWQVLEHAFGGPNHPDDKAVEFSVVDPHRFYGTYDDDRPVAIAGSFDLTLTVPGGPRPAAGVTWVGVLPTHRRQGLLTGLMRRQLDDLHAAGEAVAALWAAEGAIYQRFGYGPAAWDVSLKVPSGAGFTHEVKATGLRLTEPDAAVLAPIYDQVAQRSTGWAARGPEWWPFRLHDPEHRRAGGTPLRSVLADGPSGVDGYALYATDPKWQAGLPGGTVRVREIATLTADARARLWRYLLDLDLMARVETWCSGVDEPLLHLLAEPRSAAPTLKDNLWVRLVDVPAALASRCYAIDVNVVLEVADPLCPWNAGRWRLKGGPDGATCLSTTEPADLEVRATDLGAAYLGGTTLTARAATGQVVDLRAGRLAEVSTAFGWPAPAPYCPMVF